MTNKKPNLRIVETPLSNLRYEVQMVGAMITESKAIAIAMKKGLRPEHFTDTGNAMIAAAAIRCWNQKGSVSLFGVMAVLEDAGQLEEIGGMKQLRELQDAATPAYASDVAERLVEYARRRRCAHIGNDLMKEAQGGVNADDATREAIRRIAIVGKERSNESDVNEIAAERSAWINAVRSGEIEDRSIFFGYYDLDNILRGIRRGSFVPLAGFTSVGKTAIALNIARKLCRRGLNVTIFSLELTRGELTERLIAMESGVDYDTIIHPAHMGDEDAAAMAAGIKRINEYPGVLNIVHEPAMNTLDMWTNVEAAKHTGKPVDIAILDYLQIARPGEKKRYTSREEIVSTIAEESRRLAKSQDCVFLALCQVNDAVAGRKTPKLTISDIRESKAVGKHSDATILIYYPDWDEKPKTRALMVVDIAKHNSGPTGECKLLFDKAHQTFENHTEEDLPEWVTDD